MDRVRSRERVWKLAGCRAAEREGKRGKGRPLIDWSSQDPAWHQRHGALKRVLRREQVYYLI